MGLAGRVLVAVGPLRYRRAIADWLEAAGHGVETVRDSDEALAAVTRPAGAPPVLVLDALLPPDGLALCRQLRADPLTAELPIVVLVEPDDAARRSALAAGADELLSKPVNEPEIVARVRSVARLSAERTARREHADAFAHRERTAAVRWQRLAEDAAHLATLRRFLSEPAAHALMASSAESVMESHRRRIAVVFCDLRGFTAFAEAAEPEEVIAVLREYHAALGQIVVQFEGTIGHLAGDGLMVFFNDPLPCADPASRAVRLAIAARERLAHLGVTWRRAGHDLGFGVGVTVGYATLGQIGFDGRQDYGAIGSVVNLASRLCDEAAPGQILISRPVLADLDGQIEVETLAPLGLKGFRNPVDAYNVVELRR